MNAVQMENLTLKLGSRQIPAVSDDFYRGFKSDGFHMQIYSD
nr:MAG TPA: hypothetical protein [Caudoviricetes sp.]